MLRISEMIRQGTKIAFPVPKTVVGKVFYVDGKSVDYLRGQQIRVNFKKSGSDVLAHIIPSEGKLLDVKLDELVMAGPGKWKISWGGFNVLILQPTGK